MKLYYREGNSLKCEDIKDLCDHLNNDRVAIFIDKNRYEAIIICAYGDLFHFKKSGVVCEYSSDDYSNILSELLEKYADDFNVEVINLVISRVEKSYNAYIEAYKHVKRLVMQPDIKSAHS